jgi:hypothetical protein
MGTLLSFAFLGLPRQSEAISTAAYASTSTSKPCRAHEIGTSHAIQLPKMHTARIRTLLLWQQRDTLQGVARVGKASRPCLMGAFSKGAPYLLGGGPLRFACVLWPHYARQRSCHAG